MARMSRLKRYRRYLSRRNLPIEEKAKLKTKYMIRHKLGIYKKGYKRKSLFYYAK